MNGNYEWQKRQANERVQARLQEANAHRQANKNTTRQPLFFFLKVAIPLLVGAVIVIWLLTGCNAITDVQVVEAETAVFTSTVHSSRHSGWTMAERIRFQDKRETYLD